MLVAALRQRILELAIQGKLVPQSPEDGNAEDLYQQILLERKKLIAAGKLKKEKPLPSIKEEEIPFNIPKSWKWVRLGEVAKLGSGLTPSKQNPEFYARGTIPWLLTGDLNDGYIEKIPHKITEKALSATTIKIKPANSVVVAMYGATIGKLGILKTSACMNQACCCIEVCEGVCNLYIFYYLWANRQQLKSAGVGGAQPNISKEKLVVQMLPLPPYDEQRRIIKKVESLFKGLDALEVSQERVAAIQAELNKRILERAIQGKLVPQCREEGTAEDLYQQIQQEKKKLIAAGKLKKEKPLSPITEEENPFDIPESWKWVRLGELGVFERGAGIKKSEVVKDGLPCVRYGQLYTTYKESFSDAVSYVPEELFAKCKQAKKGDILMALTGENKPDIALAVVYEGENLLAIGGDMTRFTPIHVNSHYLMKVINSPHGIAQKVKTATGDIIVHTSNDKLAAMLIPLPPPAEQERIIHKIADLNVNI